MKSVIIVPGGLLEFGMYYLNHFKTKIKLDGCIALNAHNTLFGSKRLAIRELAVYFVHSTRPKILMALNMSAKLQVNTTIR